MTPEQGWQSIGRRVVDALRHPQWVFRRYYWSWVIRRRRPTILTKRTSNGLLSFDTRDQAIGRALYLKRKYETDLMHQALAVLRADHLGQPGDCVIDVGANIGVICIALLKHGYFREAVAVEPDPTNFALLERNVRQNDFGDRIRCVQCALSAKEGTLVLERSADNWGDHRLRAPGSHAASRDAQRTTVRVPTLTLDGLVANEESLRRPESVGLVWIDVQGHEGWCFKGASQLLSRGVPVVAEFWAEGIARSGMTPAEYSGLLRETFTHFYYGPDNETPSRPFAKHPISEIGRLFEQFTWQRKRNIIRNIILVNER